MTTLSPGCRASRWADLPSRRMSAPGAGSTRHTRPEGFTISSESGCTSRMVPARRRWGRTAGLPLGCLPACGMAWRPPAAPLAGAPALDAPAVAEVRDTAPLGLDEPGAPEVVAEPEAAEDVGGPEEIGRATV